MRVFRLGSSCSHPGLRLPLLVLATLLAACGGSSGGGDPDGGGTGVSIQLVSPTSIQAELVEGMSAPNRIVTVRVRGDVESLAAETIYVTIEDPAELYRPSGSPSSNGGDTASMSLTGSARLAPGRLTGTLEIHVALDSAGTRPLAGSPLEIPYDLTVEPGLVLESDAVTIEAPFGTGPVVRDVEAAALGGAPLEAELLPAAFEEESWKPRIAVPDASSIRLTFQAAPPGTYTYTVNVRSLIHPPGGGQVQITKPLAVTYVVTPAAEPDCVFSPAEVNATLPQYSGYSLSKYAYLLLNAGVVPTSSSPVVEYLSNPAEADGNPAAQEWLLARGSLRTAGGYSWIVVSQEFRQAVVDLHGNVYRLPPGEYTARVRFTVPRNGVEETVDLPVTFEVTPQP